MLDFEWSLEHGMMVRRRGPATAGTTASAPTIIWIHGLGEQSASFDPIVAQPSLAGFAHVLVDLPGYGRSPWPHDVAVVRTDEASRARDDTLDSLAQHVARWLANQPPAIVVGHSMGGVLATSLAERAPLRGVVNLDGNVSDGDCTFSSQALAFTEDEFAAHGFATMRDRIYESGMHDRPLRGYHAAMGLASPRMFHRNAFDLVRLSRSETLAGRFARLPCRTLFIAGVPGGICEYSRGLLDSHGITWVGVEPAGHWVFLDQLERVGQLVADFASAT